MEEINTKDFKNRYSTKGIYGDLTYGSPIVSKGFKHAVSVCQNMSFILYPNAKILVVGAGNGYELVAFLKHGFDCRGIDLYIPDVKMVKENSVCASADNIPFKDKEFDLVFCTEMMEHVPEKITENILLECKRVAKKFYFTIATTMDDGYWTHINLHPYYWWINKFQRLKFNILNAQLSPMVYILLDGLQITKHISTNEGISLYGVC